jgi:hypothetical protein
VGGDPESAHTRTGLHFDIAIYRRHGYHGAEKKNQDLETELELELTLMFIQTQYPHPLLFETLFLAPLTPSTGALSAPLSRPRIPLPPTTPPPPSPRRNQSKVHLWPTGPEARRMNQQPLHKVLIMFSLLYLDAYFSNCRRSSFPLSIPLVAPSQR